MTFLLTMSFFRVESERNKILFALSHIEEHTCIRFNELRDPDTKEYLMFYKGAG